MIGALAGTVAAVGEDAALIDVSGVGYVVHCGGRTLARLTVGEAVRVAVETHVREDMIRLFGFASEEERGWFVHLQSAPGVGARVALNILDALTPHELTEAIALGDRAAIARANGVGPKLAARIAQELAGKAPPSGFSAHRFSGPGEAPTKSSSPPATPSTARADAQSALLNLGIDPATASKAVAAASKALGAGAEASALIRAALKEINS